MTQKLPDHFSEQFTELLYDAYNKLRFNASNTVNLSNKEAEICSLFEKTLKIPLQESEKEKIHTLASRNYTLFNVFQSDDFTEILKKLEILSLICPKENQEEWCERIGQLLYNCLPNHCAQGKLSPFCERILYHMALTKAFKDGRNISAWIPHYRIKEEKVLIEIAKIAAAHKKSDISRFIQNYGITDQTALIEIAKIAAAQEGNTVSMFIENYGITNPQALIEIAKIAAAPKKTNISPFIQKYGIKDQDALIEIAKIAAAQEGNTISVSIQSYGIKKEQALIEIAKIAAGQPESRISEFIQRYGITNQQALIEIAKIAAAQNAFVTSVYIKNYRITNPQALAEIAKIAATKRAPDGQSLSVFIKNYEITDEKTLIEVAKIAAAQDGEDIFTNISNYRIANKEALFDIFTIALEQSLHPRVLKKLIEYAMELQKDDPARPVKPQFYFTILLSLQPKLDQTKLTPLIDAITQEEDRSIGEHLTIWLCLFLAKCIQEKIPLETVNFLLDKGFVQAIFEYRDPSMRFEFLGSLFLFAKNEKAVEWKSPGVTPRTCLPSLLAALLVGQGVDPKDCTSLVEISNNRVFKDRKNLKIYLQVLRLIAHSSKLSKEDKQALCVCLASTSKDILTYLYKLLGVFNLESEERLTKQALEETHGNLDVILTESFKLQLSLKEIPDLSARILKHFGKARIPYYICAYLGELKTLPEEELEKVLPKLTECVEGILEETLAQKRYNLDQSVHLKTLFEMRPLLLKKWKEGAFIPFVPSKEASSSDFDIKTFLFQKLVQDKHFKGEKMVNFIEFLQGKISQEEFLTRTEDLTPTLLVLQKACLELINAPLEKRRKILESISKHLGYFSEGAEFQNDIQALIRSLDPKIYKEEGWILTDTDDPEDLFLSGTEIEGSCQRIVGDPEYNKCLLAYVIDGKNRLLALKDSTGRIMARSLMRLLWDGKRPVLFLERLYPANVPSSWQKALESFAIQRAKALEVPLTSSEIGKGPDYPLSLSSLSSSAPYEYSDEGGGITEETFRISKAHLIA